VLDQPYDLVPLGRVWEFPHDQAVVLMAEIGRLFRIAQVPIFGRRPGKVDRVLIAFPIDSRSIGSDNAPCGEQITANHVRPARWISTHRGGRITIEMSSRIS
jgi:hypothetical protein